MSTAVAISNRINQMIDDKKTEMGIERKEAFVHCLLLMALTDRGILERAKNLIEYFDHHGADALDSRGL